MEIMFKKPTWKNHSNTCLTRFLPSKIKGKSYFLESQETLRYLVDDEKREIHPDIQNHK
jgi:hypothetical protein